MKKLSRFFTLAAVASLLLSGLLAGCENSPGDTRENQIDQSDPGGRATDM